MTVNPHPVLIANHDGVQVVSFLREGQTSTNPESVRRFFANDLLKDTEGATRLLVDLQGVVSLDSASLGPLVQKFRDVQERKGLMALCCVQSPALREIFALTRFDKVFSIYKSRGDALAALKPTP